MNKLNVRSVQIISLSVLILFSGIYSLIFGLFYNKNKSDNTPGEQEINKSISINNSSNIDTKLESDYDYSFNSDAIIILPGITGSELLSGGDYTFDNGVNVVTGDNVWLPVELLKFLDGSELDTVPLDLIDYAGISFEMLAMDENGDSIYSISPKQVDSHDLYKGTLSTATELYNRLYDEFSEKCDVIFYGYDWRYSCSATAEKLEAFINSSGYKKVTFVCHSMGGIVAAHYLDRSSENIEKTNQVITLGTPFGGSAKALMALQNGKFIEGGLLDPIIKGLSYNMQSIYELLPTDDMIESLGGYISDDGIMLNSTETRSWYTEEFKQGKDESETSVNAEIYNRAIESQNMLINDGMHIMNDSRIDVCMIAGYDLPTVQKIIEVDDYISQTASNYAGDGTVTVESATMFGGEYFDNPVYFVKEVEHRMMLKDDVVIELVVNAIRYGSHIDTEGVNKDIRTPENLIIKDNGSFEIEDVNDSKLGILFGLIYDQFTTKDN